MVRVFQPENPLIVQSDRSVLAEVASPRFGTVRDLLGRFAELEKSPEHIHTYRITPLSLWNAAASGLTAEAVVATLVAFGKYELPQNVRRDIVELMSRYGRLRLTKDDDRLLLTADDEATLARVAGHRSVLPLVRRRIDARSLELPPAMRGPIKQALIRLGYPAEDLAGYTDGEALDIRLRAATAGDDAPLSLRPYQREAVDAFHAGGTARGGSGVIVLPCGAGKTLVGMGVMEAVGSSALILTPSTVAVRQWIDELLDKTTLSRADIGEYSGQRKEIRPVTLSTYQTMTYRRRAGGDFPHLAVFDQRQWGLIVYDEVHLLPAPVFRATADIQARRRLGLTATLVREDGRADDVFSLIGPKKYDAPWRDLEAAGWIAAANCTEIRVALPDEERLAYALADDGERFALASRNPAKLDVLERLLRAHQADSVLVIGHYIDQLQTAASRFHIDLITGATPVRARTALYARLRRGEIRRLIVSKVGNFSVDLPDVSVAVQLSGTFGSRQEEAQRLGRILRPKRDGGPAHFYTLVSRETCEQDYAAHRQLFLTEQGYRYQILYGHEVPASAGAEPGRGVEP